MKIKNTNDEDQVCRGVEFPAGKAVEVDDPLLAAKMLKRPGFEEVKRGRKAKSDEDDA